MSAGTRSLTAKVERSVIRKPGSSGLCFSSGACPGVGTAPTHNKVHRTGARAQPTSAPLSPIRAPFKPQVFTDNVLSPSGATTPTTMASSWCGGSSSSSPPSPPCPPSPPYGLAAHENEEQNLELDDIGERGTRTDWQLPNSIAFLQCCRDDPERSERSERSNKLMAAKAWNETSALPDIELASIQAGNIGATSSRAPGRVGPILTEANMQPNNDVSVNSRRSSGAGSPGSGDTRDKWQRALDTASDKLSGSDRTSIQSGPSIMMTPNGSNDAGEAQQRRDAWAQDTVNCDDDTEEAEPVVTGPVVSKEELSFGHLRKKEALMVAAQINGSPSLAYLKLTGSKKLTALNWESVFGAGSSPAVCLKWLDLNANAFGNSGSVTIANWLGHGRCPELIHVNLRENGIGRDGTLAFAKALGGGNCPRLATVWLQNNQIDDVGAAALAVSLGNGHCQSLSLLGLSRNCIGTTGAKALAVGLGQGHWPELTLIGLAGNNIGKEGADMLTSSLKQHHSPQTITLVLDGNPTSKQTCK